MKNMRLNDGKTFAFTPNEFKKRFDAINSILVKHYNDSKYNTLLTPIDDGSLTLYILDENYDAVAAIQYTDTSDSLTEQDQDKKCISCIMAFLMNNDTADWAEIILNVILTCDNTLEVSDASDIAKSVLLTVASGKPYTYNGIRYAFSPLGDSYVFVSSLIKK